MTNVSTDKDAVKTDSETSHLKKIRRRNYLPAPRIQLEHIAYYITALVLILGYQYFKMRQILVDLLTMGHGTDQMDVHLQATFANTLSSLNWLFVFSSLKAVILVFIGGIFFTHRVAGPVHNLILYFREIRETGQIRRSLKFRTHDYFKELPPAVNDALAKLISEKPSGGR